VSPPDCKAAHHLRETILDAIAPLPVPSREPDERLAHIMALIDDLDYLCDPASVGQLAGEIYLTTSWLRYLFRKQVGLSIDPAVHPLGAGAAGDRPPHLLGFV
jgi:hypothetical protein